MATTLELKNPSPVPQQSPFPQTRNHFTAKHGPRQCGMAQEYEGKCLCGAVTYKVKGPFIRFFFCHCSRCRRASGTAHAANIFTRAGNVTFLSGEDKTRRFDAPDAEQYARCFCTECGSPVPYTSRDGKVQVVPAGSLTHFADRKVDANVFWDNRADWYDTGLTAPHKTEAEMTRR